MAKQQLLSYGTNSVDIYIKYTYLNTYTYISINSTCQGISTLLKGSPICLIILPEIQQQADFPRWLPPQPQQKQQFNRSANLCGTKDTLSPLPLPQGISAALK